MIKASIKTLPAKTLFRKRIERFKATVSVLLLSGLLLGGCTSPKSTADTELPTTTSLPSAAPKLRLTKQATVPISSVAAGEGDKKVTISGTVAKRVAILGGWLYQVSDNSGSVWVLTTASDPTVGQVATVEGTIRYEAIAVGEIDAGDVYLEESAYSGAQSDTPEGNVEAQPTQPTQPAQPAQPAQPDDQPNSAG